MLQLILEKVLASEVEEVICVTDDLEAARRDIKLVDSRLVWHFNAASRNGQSSAVIAGLWASDPKSDGIMFVAELPPFRRQVIEALRGCFDNSQASIVAAKAGDQAPNPIMFRRELYPELLKLTGDDRGVSLLEKHAEKTTLVEWEAEPNLVKVNSRQTPERFKERV